MNKLASLTMVSFIGAILMIGCGGNSSELEVQDVWSRSSPSAAQNGVFYMTIINNSDQDDALLSVETDACNVAELHEMYMMENDLMGMRPALGGVIELPAGETVKLKTGGLHVMCLGKQIEFEVGVEIPLTLYFEQAGEMRVTAVIRDS